MIRLNEIEKYFGSRRLFGNLTWHIKPGDKIGLVGQNGAGKTTLFNIIAGEDRFDHGDRVLKSGLSIGFLRQESEIDSPSTSNLLDETVKGGRPDLTAIQSKINLLAAKLDDASAEDAASIARDLGKEEEKFQQAGGYTAESEAKSILSGLGFTGKNFSQSLDTFSGGWRMRAELASLLLGHPDILLLDEPTNHLDIESTVWLEAFLGRYTGAVLIISHDRFFLNRMVNITAELENAALTIYSCPYDQYIIEKQDRIERTKKQAVRQGKQIAKQEKFIERFRAKNTKATAVQSRIKALDKIVRIKTVRGSKNIAISFRESGRMAKEAVSVKNVTCGYGDEKVYENLDYLLLRGDRVALVGPNGAGKSTLLKLLAGVIPVTKGSVSIGPGVIMRYYAQRQAEELDPDKTVFDEVYDSSPVESITAVRTALGSLGITGDDVTKKIKVLSGGERSRVALSKLALTPTNLLLLDEPTNHLDLKSRQALEAALANYGGAILLISHDRAFIDAVATKVVHVEGGKLTEFLGGWSYYERKRKELEENSEAVFVDETTPKKSKKEARRQAAEARRKSGLGKGSLKDRISKIEERISASEDRIAFFEKELCQPDIYESGERALALNRDLAAGKLLAVELLAEWEKLTEQLENI